MASRAVRHREAARALHRDKAFFTDFMCLVSSRNLCQYGSFTCVHKPHTHARVTVHVKTSRVNAADAVLCRSWYRSRATAAAAACIGVSIAPLPSNRIFSILCHACSGQTAKRTVHAALCQPKHCTGHACTTRIVVRVPAFYSYTRSTSLPQKPACTRNPKDHAKRSMLKQEKTESIRKRFGEK